jgi:hypothetical protein
MGAAWARHAVCESALSVFREWRLKSMHCLSRHQTEATCNFSWYCGANTQRRTSGRCRTFTWLFVTQTHKNLYCLHINFVPFQTSPALAFSLFISTTVDTSCHFRPFRKITKSDSYLRRVRLLVRLWAGNNSVGRILVKSYSRVYHENI